MFKEKLEKGSRINIPPLSISLKEGSVPSYLARPYDTPIHLRQAYDKELQNKMDAGILEPMGLRESDWCLRAFLVLKSDGCNVRVVTELKAVSRCIKRPTNPTDFAISYSSK